MVEPLAEANFLFAGRRDQQVKINGYRIELAELDNFVRKRVQSNFYLHAHKPINQPEQLLLFIEGSSSDEYKELMNDLNHCFPMHMIPLIVLVEEIPLNINSKVDVVSLLEKMQLS